MKHLMLILCLIIAGCAAPPIKIDTIPIEPVIIQPAPPARLTMLPVNLIVVNKANQESQLKTIFSNDDSFVAINMQSYENISLNFADITRYIQQQQDIIDYYKTITTPVTKLPNEK